MQDDASLATSAVGKITLDKERVDGFSAALKADRVAIGSGDRIQVWKIPDRKLAEFNWSLEGPVESLAFYPDGRFLLAGYGNGVVVLGEIIQEGE